MTPRRRRMVIVGAIFLGVTAAVTLGLQGMQDSMLYFRSPTEVLSGEAVDGRDFRLGGMVREGSVERQTGELEMSFDITDFDNTITVRYTGITPALFGEGQGVIAIGRMEGNNIFQAREVLAKHDENYMPVEVADMLAQQQQSSEEQTTESSAN